MLVFSAQSNACAGRSGDRHAGPPVNMRSPAHRFTVPPCAERCLVSLRSHSERCCFLQRHISPHSRKPCSRHFAITVTGSPTRRTWARTHLAGHCSAPLVRFSPAAGLMRSPPSCRACAGRKTDCRSSPRPGRTSIIPAGEWQHFHLDPDHGRLDGGSGTVLLFSYGFATSPSP